MKILFVLDYYVPHIGGAETLFKNVIERLAARGHQVTVLTCRHNAEVPAYEKMGEGIEVYRTGGNRFALMLRIPFVGYRLAKEADVIHSTTYTSAIPASVLGIVSRRPVVLTVHEVFWKLWYRFMGAKGFFFKLFESAIFAFPFAKYLCVSHYTKNSLRLLFGLPDAKLATVYNGVDTDFWNASQVDSARVAAIREELGIADCPSALYFGRPGVSKGLEFVVDAIPEIVSKIPDFKAVLIVSGDERDRSDFIKSKVAKSGVSNRVVWIPGVKYAELRNYVSAVDAVIVPSLVEGFGFSAAETCALWQNLVVTSAWALPEVVYGNVVHVEPSNAADLARGVVAMLRGGSSNISKKDFSWEENVDLTLSAYGDALSKHSANHSQTWG